MSAPSAHTGPVQRIGRLKPWAVYAHDLAWAAAVMAGVLLLRYRLERLAAPDHLISRSTLTFTAVCALVFPLFGLHRGMWRYTALNDVARVAGAVGTAVAATLPLLFVVNRLEDFPRSAPLVVAGVLLAVLAFDRALAQAWSHGDLGAALRLEDRSRAPAVLVGSPAAAAAYLTASRRRRDAHLRTAGIVTLSPADVGRAVQGVEVLGDIRRLAAILKALEAGADRTPHVVVAEPRPGRALLDRVVAASSEAGARISRVRGDTAKADIVPVSAADLLDRPPRVLDPVRARSLVEGRRVLVTGAGGTIGGELTRQALKLGPAAVTLVDASEFNLYALDAELRETGASAPFSVELGDVRDGERMAALFARARPEVVLHAAALKHVPLMELNPTEAVRTNLGGALICARLARETAAVFTFISTDKAVNPTNVMGATKRAAERAVRAVLAGSPCRAAVVRFGNVLGSTGSVVPLFERQIAEGGPLTVTHPDMVRFFMTVQEAAALVLQASALPDAGGVHVLDMGEPVRIADLARQMIRLHGLRPDEDVEIRHTGLRPGEKLFEEVFYAAEEVRPTAVDGVLAAADPTPSWSQLCGPVEALLAAAAAQDEAATLARLHALVPQFTRG